MEDSSPAEEITLDETTPSPSPPAAERKEMEQVAERLVRGGNLEAQIEAARDVRKLVRKSKSSSKVRSWLAAAGVIQPLVFMLHQSSAREAALLALLNLAVRNERNKIKIVSSGAIPPLIGLFQVEHENLRELATATILSLSAAAANKPTITASGVVPLLMHVLRSGSLQGRVDAVTALHNLSSSTEEPKLALDAAAAAAPLINLLKECKKYSKFAEKATSLVEILSHSEEGRTAISTVDGGILTLVLTVEEGSIVSTEHAAGALLSFCQSDRDKYRELILQEGPIPGLLRLTAEGSPEAQDRARLCLDLLRESPEKRMSSTVFKQLVYDFATQVDGTDNAAETAKRLMEDVVHRNIERRTN